MPTAAFWRGIAESLTMDPPQLHKMVLVRVCWGDEQWTLLQVPLLLSPLDLWVVYGHEVAILQTVTYWANKCAVAVNPLATRLTPLHSNGSMRLAPDPGQSSALQVRNAALRNLGAMMAQVAVLGAFSSPLVPHARHASLGLCTLEFHWSHSDDL